MTEELSPAERVALGALAWRDSGYEPDRIYLLKGTINEAYPPPMPRLNVNESEPFWVETAWKWVENGDRVRLGTAEAMVEKVTKFEGHTRVETFTNRHGKQQDNVTSRWDHLEVSVLLQGRTSPMPFPPDAPVEVWMDAERRAQHELAVQMGGVAISPKPEAPSA